MSKYKILKEQIQEWIEREKENFDEARKYGVNTPGASMAVGAIEAYEQVLRDIAELESEVTLS